MNQRGVRGCAPKDEKVNTTKHIDSPTIWQKASQDIKIGKKARRGLTLRGGHRQNQSAYTFSFAKPHLQKYGVYTRRDPA